MLSLADFLISLFTCEKSCKTGKHASKGLEDAQKTLGVVSLVFSCLFMVELLASVWAFGIRQVARISRIAARELMSPKILQVVVPLF